MKKTLFAFLICVITIVSCERDDICIDPVTPKLIINFFDASNTTNIKRVNIDVRLLDIDLADGVSDTLNFGTVDSISLPLRVDSDTTRYEFIEIVNDSTTLKDIVTLTYTREEIFVGRSCGYKTIFKNVVVTTTNNWIDSFNTTNGINQTIEDEQEAHLTIFH